MSGSNRGDKTIKRRSALLGIGATGAALGGYLWVRERASSQGDDFAPPRNEAPLAKLIRKRLPMLRLPPATLSAFVVDHVREHGEFKSKRVKNKLVQRFLLSTDFFPAADESKALAYVGYHDPYLTPCRNPFRGS